MQGAPDADDFILKLAVLEAIRRPGEAFEAWEIAEILEIDLMSIHEAQRRGVRKMREALFGAFALVAGPPHDYPVVHRVTLHPEKFDRLCRIQDDADINYSTFVLWSPNRNRRRPPPFQASVASADF